MASAPELTVAVEKAVHQGLRDAVQAVFDQHGIRIISVRVDWNNVSAFGHRPEFKVAELRAETVSD